MDPLKSCTNSLASTKKLNDFDNEIDDNYILKKDDKNSQKLITNRNKFN